MCTHFDHQYKSQHESKSDTHSIVIAHSTHFEPLMRTTQSCPYSGKVIRECIKTWLKEPV